jgi:hypothetical protein
VTGELGRLLERACDLEPKRFRITARHLLDAKLEEVGRTVNYIDVVLDGALLPVAMQQGDGWCLTEPHGEALALIQAAVQEAIEARGWGWTLDCYHSKRYGALRYLAWLTVTPEHCESDASKAATALLYAYLGALAAVEAAKETT